MDPIRVVLVDDHPVELLSVAAHRRAGRLERQVLDPMAAGDRTPQ